ncbi:MAG TPA: HNH endonuclease family protein [Nocardioides sp.]
MRLTWGTICASVLAALSLAVSGCAAEVPDRSAEPARHTSAHPSGPAPVRLLRLLARVRIAETSYAAGYDRSCAPGHGCVFGEEWTDEYAGPDDRVGCDTREDVLLHQMSDIQRRWGDPCRIYQATLTDPYTGARLTWRHDGYRIQIDHVYPLAQAWYAGASRWPLSRRVRFANDVRRELLAVGAAVNDDKGSRTPAAWLPPRVSFRCTYLAKYLTVAAAYDLSVTPADAATVRAYAPRCR